MKVLILTDFLNVGGAETHVELLAKELISLGNEVTVACSGGKICEKLKQSNVKIVYLAFPSISKASNGKENFSAELLSALPSVWRLVRNEKPDVVHAHTRRTAFLAHFVCKAANIPLTVTAHARFSMKFPKNLLSKWGDATIAVSKDIRNHLIKHGVSPSRIKVIPNGVKLADEIKLGGEKSCAPKIVFVSRLDADCSLGAYLLCKIAPRLSQKYKDLKIIIVGGGTEYHKLCNIASGINSRLKCELIYLAGEVDDPAVYFQKNTLFIGVSRSALEAMAHSLPVILLGNEGYLGLLGEQNTDFAQSTNFTCRNSKPNYENSTLSSVLYDEICRYFELSDEEKSRLSILSRETVKSNYTARNMAKKTVDFYKDTIENHQKKLIASNFSVASLCVGERVNPSCKSAKKGRKKIAICGYYGHGNLGDEAILSVIIQKLLQIYPDSEIRILTVNNPISSLLSLFKSELFIFGGGSLLQNSTSNASLFYYLATLNTARFLSKRKIMLANGIGPIKSGPFSQKFLYKIIARSINTFDFISLRDIRSQKLIQELLPDRKIHLIRDPALIYKKKINNKSNKTERNPYFSFIPCACCQNKDSISMRVISKRLSDLEKSFCASPIITVMNPNEDLAFAKKLCEYSPNAKILCPDTPQKLASLLCGAEFVISERYHGALFSAVSGVPLLAVSDDPKTLALCQDFSLFFCQNPTIFGDFLKLKEALLKAIEYHIAAKEEISHKIKQSALKTDRFLEKIL